MEGFSALGVLDAVRMKPWLFQFLLQYATQLYSAKEVEALFTTTNYSAEGSNRRELEYQRRAWFADFLLDIESKYKVFF